MRYTMESVSKYWDSDDVRIFTLKMNENGVLSFTSSNNTNIMLYSHTDAFMGKSLYDIMEKEHADMWHSRYIDWKKLGTSSYYAYFEDPTVAWDTTIDVINDTVFGIGVKVNVTELNFSNFDDYEFFNHYYVQQEDFINFSLFAQLQSDSFTIESIDAPNKFHFQEFVGKDISAFMYYCTNILSKSIFHKCLETRKVIHYVEKYTKGNTSIYFDIKLIPNVSNSRITMYAKIINEPLYKQMQKKVSSFYGLYPETDDLATCEINIEDEHNPYIIGCNHYFKSLLKDTKMHLSTIISNDVFQKSLSTFTRETGEFITEHQLGNLLYFNISVTHISDMRNYIFLVTLMPKNRQLTTGDFQNNNLTAREKEILTFVGKGYLYKNIAKELDIKEGTVKKTIYNGYRKLGISSRVELIKLIYDESLD